jgi:hypothetical protein
MKAAYYRLRCFVGDETERPVLVSGVIVYGRDEAALEKGAERQFARYASPSRPKMKEERIGPYVVESVAALWGEDGEVNWGKVESAVAMQETAELRTGASCVFQSRMAAEVEGKVLTDREAEEYWRKHREILGRAWREEGKGMSGGFYFVGAAYDERLHRPKGKVYLIEAKGLDEAGAICADFVGGKSTWTEWCPAIVWCGPQSD